MPVLEVIRRGPLFVPGLPAARINEALQGAVQELVELGEQRLDQMLRPRPAGVYLSVAQARKGKASTGNYRRNLNAKAKGMHGIINDGGVIYGRWLEGTSSRNQTTRFKGYASFRRTADFLNRNKRKVLEAHVNKLVRMLG